jgi:hypothetical protein
MIETIEVVVRAIVATVWQWLRRCAGEKGEEC